MYGSSSEDPQVTSRCVGLHVGEVDRLPYGEIYSMSCSTQMHPAFLLSCWQTLHALNIT